MVGIFITTAIGPNLAQHISAMEKATAEWTHRAARMECSWVCAGCCVTFPQGMPDACPHGHECCTKIIQSDKADALAAQGNTP